MKKKQLIIIPLLVLFIVILPVSVSAFEFDPYGWAGETGVSTLETEGVAEGTIEIINWILGFLSLFALILLIYAGFSYMFSAGDAEKVKRAKNILLTTVIGLFIVISSYVISRFAFELINESTGGGSKGPTAGEISPECAEVGGRVCEPLGGTAGGYNINDCDDLLTHVYHPKGMFEADDEWEDLGSKCSGGYTENCYCSWGYCCGVDE